jgi:uncharacterized protein YbaA (DUF1428 family)
MFFGRDVKINVTKIVSILFFTDAKEQAEVLIGASRFTTCIAVSVLDENVTGTAINVAVDRGVCVILANWMAYRSRKVRLDFGESRYVFCNEYCSYRVDVG